MTLAVPLLGLCSVLAIGLWLTLRGPDIPYAILEARYSGHGSAFVELAGGVRLHYRVDGNPAALPLVLVHGFGDSSTTWDGWTGVLAARYRVLSIDLPGHGLTRAPRDFAASAASYVAVLGAFVDALDLPAFALAGNSMGGAVAWQYALSDPRRVCALILVAAAGWPLPPPGVVPLAFRILRYRAGRWLLARIDNRALIRQGLRKDVHDPAVITAVIIDRWAALQRAPGHRPILMAADVATFGTATDSALAAVRAPTLVLQGAEDPLIPVVGSERFARAIAGAELIVYQRVGHLPQLEIPGRSAADVGAFLARATPRK